MARRIRWTEAAHQDFEQAVDFIARDSETYAALFARQIWSAAQSLVELSHRGRIVPEIGDPDVRELIVRPYRLIYRVTEDAVTILSVLHGARDLTRLAGPDD